MKKQLLLIALATLATGNLCAAVTHNLKNNGMAQGLKQVYIAAENKNDLAPIIKKYYDRVQQGEFDIPFEDLKELYDELCKINCENIKHQI